MYCKLAQSGTLSVTPLPHYRARHSGRNTSFVVILVKLCTWYTVQMSRALILPGHVIQLAETITPNLLHPSHTLLYKVSWQFVQFYRWNVYRLSE